MTDVSGGSERKDDSFGFVLSVGTADDGDDSDKTVGAGGRKRRFEFPGELKCGDKVATVWRCASPLALGTGGGCFVSSR